MECILYNTIKNLALAAVFCFFLISCSYADDVKEDDNDDDDENDEDDDENDNDDDESLTKNGRNGTAVENPKQDIVDETVTKTPVPAVKDFPEPVANGGVQDQAAVPVQEKNF